MQIALIAAIALIIGALGAGTYVSYTHKKVAEQSPSTTMQAEVSAEGVVESDAVAGNPTPQAGTAPAPVAPQAQAQARVAVVVNDVKLTDAQIQALEKKYSTTIAGGNYWYDVKTGAWGKIGGPTEGWLEANENIGGNMKANASGNAKTGIFINGRELHPTDVKNLNALLGVYGATSAPGSYWVDASGNFGLVGQSVVMGNLVQMMQGAQASGKSSSYYKTNGTDYTGFGGGGGFSYFSSKNDYNGSSSVFVDETGVNIDYTPKSSDY